MSMIGRNIVDTFVLGSSMGLGLGSVFLFVRWLANFVAGRIDKKEARLDAGMNELVNELKEQVGGLKTDGAELRLRVTAAEAAHAQCEHRLAEVEAKALRSQALLDAMGDARQHAQLILAAEKAAEKLEGKKAGRKE